MQMASEVTYDCDDAYCISAPNQGNIVFGPYQSL